MQINPIRFNDLSIILNMSESKKCGLAFLKRFTRIISDEYHIPN